MQVEAHAEVLCRRRRAAYATYITALTRWISNKPAKAFLHSRHLINLLRLVSSIADTARRAKRGSRI
jgi:hypothetical protein